MRIGLRETTPGFISVWKPEKFCGYVSKPGIVDGVPYRAYALRNGCEIVGDFTSVREAIRAVATNAI
jgi:hypothetical protein